MSHTPLLSLVLIFKSTYKRILNIYIIYVISIFTIWSTTQVFLYMCLPLGMYISIVYIYINQLGLIQVFYIRILTKRFAYRYSVYECLCVGSLYM